MVEHLERYHRPDQSEITDGLVEYLQQLAFAAWRESMPEERTDEQLRVPFNTDPDHIRKVQSIYRDCAIFGGLIMLAQGESDDPVGYALVKEEWRRIGSKRRTLPFLMHVCISAEHQGHGMGPRLIAEALSSYAVSDDPVAAYIFEENQKALHVFSKLGFAKKPLRQAGHPVDFFGDDHPPVIQLRFEAPSVQTVFASVPAA